MPISEAHPDPARLSRRAALAILGGGALALAAGCKPVGKAGAAPLKVGNQKGTVKALMSAAGVLSDLPYAIEWSEFPAAQDLLQALAAGAVDVGLVGDAPYLFAFVAGSPLQVVSAVAYGDGAGTAIIVPPNSPVRTFKDLRGKRIATGKVSIGNYLVLRALETNGMTLKDIQPVYMSPADAKAALSSGNIDAWSTWSPFLATEIVQDHARVIINGQGLLSSHAYQVATRAAITGKDAQLRDFLTRQTKAYIWAGSHKDAYAAALSRDTGLPPDVARLTVGSMNPADAPLDAQLLAEADDVVKHLSAVSDTPMRPRPIAEAFAPEFRAGQV